MGDAIRATLPVSIRSRLFEAGEPGSNGSIFGPGQFQSAPASLRRENGALHRAACGRSVSIRSRLFEAGEHRLEIVIVQSEEFQSAPASLRRENPYSRARHASRTCFNPLPPL